MKAVHTSTKFIQKSDPYQWLIIDAYLGFK